MTHHENLKILAFTGLTGSGKSTAVKYFTEKGYPKVYGGGILYQAMADAGIERGEDNEKNFRREIREREGEDFIIKRLIQQIHDLADAGQHHIVVDGGFSWEEYKLTKHEFPGEVTFVAIIAPRHKRYHWLESREERPQTAQISQERDYNEIESLQKGGPIAMADYFVHNEGTPEEFYRALDQVAKEIKF